MEWAKAFKDWAIGEGGWFRKDLDKLGGDYRRHEVKRDAKCFHAGFLVGQAGPQPEPAPLKAPYFDPHTGQLLPCGLLKPFNVTCERHAKNRIYFISCIWIDEAGLKWDIGYHQTDTEVRPVSWPCNIRAIYTIICDARGSTYSMTANSFEEAVETLKVMIEGKGHYWWDDRIQLKSVSAPQDL